MVEDNFDYDARAIAANDLAAELLLDDIIEAARNIPYNVYMNELEREKSAIIDLAYKLHMER